MYFAFRESYFVYTVTCKGIVCMIFLNDARNENVKSKGCVWVFFFFFFFFTRFILFIITGSYREFGLFPQWKATCQRRYVCRLLTFVLIMWFHFLVMWPAGEDGVIHVWDLGSGAVLRECPSTGNSLSQQVTSLAFSPDGTLLASSSYGNQIKLWNVRTLSTAPQPQSTNTR